MDGFLRELEGAQSVKSLQEKLDEKEKVCILESQVQQHLAEASRLRQDVLRLQTLADERGLTVEKVQKREDNSSEKASEMQKRLQETQSALLTEPLLQGTHPEMYHIAQQLTRLFTCAVGSVLLSRVAVELLQSSMCWILHPFILVLQESLDFRGCRFLPTAEDDITSILVQLR
eukprot:s1642_g1.t1